MIVIKKSANKFIIEENTIRTRNTEWKCDKIFTNMGDEVSTKISTHIKKKSVNVASPCIYINGKLGKDNKNLAIDLAVLLSSIGDNLDVTEIYDGMETKILTEKVTIYTKKKLTDIDHHRYSHLLITINGTAKFTIIGMVGNGLIRCIKSNFEEMVKIDIFLTEFYQYLRIGKTDSKDVKSLANLNNRVMIYIIDNDSSAIRTLNIMASIPQTNLIKNEDNIILEQKNKIIQLQKQLKTLLNNSSIHQT